MEHDSRRIWHNNLNDSCHQASDAYIDECRLRMNVNKFAMVDFPLLLGFVGLAHLMHYTKWYCAAIRPIDADLSHAYSRVKVAWSEVMRATNRRAHLCAVGTYAYRCRDWSKLSQLIDSKKKTAGILCHLHT